MVKINKKIIIISATILLIFAITFGIIFILFTTKNSPQATIDNNKTVTQQSADSIKAQAIEAMQNNDVATAKVLLDQAKEQYDALNDTDIKTADQIDVEAQLWAIDHPATSTQENNNGGVNTN